jgi:hypothetical protein
MGAIPEKCTEGRNIVDMTLRDVMLKSRKKGGDSMSNHCICEVAEA